MTTRVWPKVVAIFLLNVPTPAKHGGRFLIYPGLDVFVFRLAPRTSVFVAVNPDVFLEYKEVSKALPCTLPVQIECTLFAKWVPQNLSEFIGRTTRCRKTPARFRQARA